MIIAGQGVCPGPAREGKIMKIHVSVFSILLIIVLAGIVVTGVNADVVSGQVSPGKGTTPVVDAPLLDSLGISSADQQTLTRKAQEVSDRYKSMQFEEKSAVSAAGIYREDSMEKITTSNGQTFEGGTTITFTISPDNKVSGDVAFKFIEQGWTIKVKGTVTGFLTPDTGKLIIKSNDASVKYAGKQHKLTMNIEAQYNGSGFVGTKELSIAGATGTLGFTANPA
jgi:hypothetical protein